MSSISGIWQHGVRVNVPAWHGLMQLAQSMYGPDGEFSWNDSRIALGGNLMRLLPEDRYDRQPVWSEDRSVCLAADVRLDNRSELEKELGLVHPEEIADSAILMAAWRRWGEASLDHIVGGFAFAAWTPDRQELFLARDHSGERPLFYHEGDGFFAFASMPKGLLALPGVSRGFDERHLAGAMMLEQPELGKSFFTGVAQLAPGHRLRVTSGRVEGRRYWHPADAKPVRFARDEDYAEGLLEVLDRATAARLRSTKGIGAELSSGLDSSSVASSAARLLGAEDRKLTAFTSVPRKGFLGLAPRGRLANEGPGAADVTRMYPNMEHVVFDTEGCDLLDSLKTLTDALDEPIRNGVNQLWISSILTQARERGLGVMLQGALGNATISYEGKAALIPMFQRGHWIDFLGTAHTLRQNGHLSIRAAAALATNGWQPRWLKRLLMPDLRVFQPDYSAIHPDMVEKYGLLQRMTEDFYGTRPDVITERARFFERFDHGPMNAAVRAVFGVDQRDPCGDKRVFDYCYAIPLKQYLVGGQTRSLVRRAMRGRLPQATLTRTLRGIQAADWYLTVADALPSFERELGAIACSPEARKMIDLNRMRQLSAGLPDAGYETAAVANAWGQALPRGVAYGYFLRKWEQ